MKDGDTDSHAVRHLPLALHLVCYYCLDHPAVGYYTGHTDTQGERRGLTEDGGGGCELVSDSSRRSGGPEASWAGSSEVPRSLATQYSRSYLSTLRTYQGGSLAAQGGSLAA